MKTTFLLLSTAVLSGFLLTGCGDNSKTTQTGNAASNVVDAPANYISAVSQAQKYSEKVIDVSYINQDIQMFKASEGRNPKDLQELIPDYLGKMPVVPNGYQLDYDPATGTVKVVKP